MRKPHLVVSRETKAPVRALNPFSATMKRNLALSLLLGLTLAVYFRATLNPFIQHDDQDYVLENQHVQQGLNAATLRWALTSTEESNWHPLTWLSHALDCQLFGLNPAGHHFTNVLLHVLNVGLLFWLLWRATGAIGRSFMVAALFALHPLNVESVAWVAERKNVLCMFFFLLTLGAYGWYTRRPGWKRYLAVAGLFVLALAAKPMAVTLPCVLLLVDFWPLRRVQSREAPSEEFPVTQQPLGRLVLEKLPLLALSVASSVITVIAQKGAIKQHLSFSPRLVNALYAYAMYLLKMLWPAHLAALYPYEGARLPAWQAFLWFALLGSITAIVWHERKRLYPPVGWFWYLGTLVPMIGLVQVGDQGMADRYTYLPLVGIFVMVVWGVADWVPAGQLKQRWCLLAVGIILAVLSVLTWRQIRTWRSGHDLWSHTLQVTKDNYLAEEYMAFELVSQSRQTTGPERCTDEIFTHFQTYEARVVYVLGEFYWKVQAGETCKVSDYVSPPMILSREQTGQEEIWTLGEYIEPETLWSAFHLTMALPPRVGVAPNQPSPYKAKSSEILKLFGYFCLAAILIHLVLSLLAQNKLVYENQFIFQQAMKEKALVTDFFEISGHSSNVVIKSTANVNNNWIYLHLALINEEGQAYDFGREISYYHGVEGGERWSEGGTSDEATLPAIPAGKYYLRIEPESSSPIINYTIRVYRDVPRWSFFILALAVLCLVPILMWWRSGRFEAARWSEGDSA